MNQPHTLDPSVSAALDISVAAPPPSPAARDLGDHTTGSAASIGGSAAPQDAVAGASVVRSAAYDWDAATAAAFADTDEPSSSAPHPHTVSEPERLLEDIIREIVGDAAADTVSSLHSARAAATAAPDVDPGAGALGPASAPSPDEPASASPSQSSQDDPSVVPSSPAPAPADEAAAFDTHTVMSEDVRGLAAVAPDSDTAGSRVLGDLDAPDELLDDVAPSPETSAVLESVGHEHHDDASVSRETLSTATVPGSTGDTRGPTPELDASDEPTASNLTMAASPPQAQPENIIITTAVSRETAAEYGGTPLADQIADETRRRIALETAVLPLPASTRVFTISNQKGGVGKTTTAVNLAAALARSGAHVLVVDLDPQGNASTALGVDHRSDQQSVYEVLVADLELAQVVRPSTEHERLDCVPATIHLAGAEIELVSLVAREQRLRRAIDKHLASMERPYDYVFIDCPPSLGLLTINAFVAAREVLIPIQCEYYALEGLSQLLSNIELIEKHLNSELRLSTILLTMYDSRTNLAQQVAQEVRDHFPVQTLETIIPRSVRVSEAPSYGQSVISYDYSSSGSLSYREAAAEIAQRAAIAAAQKEGI